MLKYLQTAKKYGILEEIYQLSSPMSTFFTQLRAYFTAQKIQQNSDNLRP